MPLYEYYCQGCRERVTVRRSFSDTSSPCCPLCGGGNLTRVMSKVSIVKSDKDRIRDVSWIDKNLANRFKL